MPRLPLRFQVPLSLFKGPKNNRNVRIRHCASRPQTKGIPRSMLCRILVFLDASGPLILLVWLFRSWLLFLGGAHGGEGFPSPFLMESPKQVQARKWDPHGYWIPRIRTWRFVKRSTSTYLGNNADPHITVQMRIPVPPSVPPFAQQQSRPTTRTTLSYDVGEPFVANLRLPRAWEDGNSPAKPFDSRGMAARRLFT